MRKYEIESAMSTLQRASEIQKNAKLMTDVKRWLLKKQKNLTALLLVKRFNHGQNRKIKKKRNKTCNKGNKAVDEGRDKKQIEY
jgi:hypothetical protein